MIRMGTALGLVNHLGKLALKNNSATTRHLASKLLGTINMPQNLGDSAIKTFVSRLLARREFSLTFALFAFLAQIQEQTRQDVFEKIDTHIDKIDAICECLEKTEGTVIYEARESADSLLEIVKNSNEPEKVLDAIGRIEKNARHQ